METIIGVTMIGDQIVSRKYIIEELCAPVKTDLTNSAENASATLK